MIRLRKILLIAVIYLTFNICQSVSACTNVTIKAADGSVIIGRSLEFSLDFHSNIRSSPRGRAFNTIAQDGKPGLSWKAKYGYIFLDGLGIDTVVDGMNETGLSFGELLFPGYAKYPDIPAGLDHQALPYMSFGDWVLGNFKTVDEVRSALSNVYVYLNTEPSLGTMTFPVHYIITDTTGKGIIIEYNDGNMHIYDSMGVMTNSPTYDWQTTNLQNYLHLSPFNPTSVSVNGEVFAVTGQGYGMIGIPGDISPPSRFVKMALYSHVAVTTRDAASALNMAEHLMNNVDVPQGIAREPHSGKYINDITQWVVFKDLTNKVFYYRTYNDLSLHAVTFSKVDLSEKAQRFMMPIASKEYVNDVSGPFTQSK
jgi:choloylglycine hydrolase